MKEKRYQTEVILPQWYRQFAKRAVPVSLSFLLAAGGWANSNIAFSPFSDVSTMQQQQSVSGVVKGSDGETLVGVHVRVKGTNKATLTDADGRYSINAPEGAVLQFTYIGYEKQEISVSHRVLDVVLHIAENSLEEAVVIGYGSVRKADLAGSVAVMDQKAFRDQPITQVSDAIQGRVSGVQVINSGVPGGSVKVRVRGTSSIHNSNEPLYVVDGVVRESGITGINPEDIQSMQVLKDASSTAIYGSRGSNGVVLIQTKNGKSGRTEVIFDASLGMANATRLPKVMGTKEYADLYVKYKLNGTPTAALQPFLDGSNAGIDWVDQVTQSGLTQNYKLSISKGNQDTQFYLSGNYMNNEGVVVGTGFERYNVKLNASSKVFNWLEVIADIQASRNEGKRGGFGMGQTNPLWIAYNYSPTMNMYLSDGRTFSRDPYNAASADNPYALLTADESESLSNIVTGRVDFKFHLAKGLTFTTTNGVDYSDSKGYGFRPLRMNNGQNSMSNSDRYHLMLQSTNNLTYNNKWGDHGLTVTAVYEAMQSETRTMGISGKSLRAESVGWWDVKNATIRDSYNEYSKYAIMSGVGRIMYNYADRYMLTATFRADGSSRFSKDKWGYFPSIAAAWTMSNEDFMKPLRDQISNAKLRISYGVIGNQNISPYSTLGLMSTTSFNFGTSNNYTGYIANGIATPNLTWEKTKQFDLGIDLGFWNNRLELGIDIFSKRTTDALLKQKQPGYLGGAAYWINAGEIKNSGIDLGLTAHIFQSSDFGWSTTLNASYNKNKVVKLTAADPILYGSSPSQGTVDPVSIVKEGEAIGTFYGYVWEGLDPVTGLDKYQDLNQNGKIDADDRQVIGNANPDITFGWNNTLRYKQWEFNAFFNAAFGAQRLNLVRFAMNSMVGASMFVTDADYIANMGKTMPSLDAVGNNNLGNSTKWLENADYFRAENISIAYNLTREQTKFANIRLSFSVQNLFTITNYKGSDPSGFSFGNSDYENGVDMGAFPTARTFTLGARFTF